jgi:hypothetical protein
MINILSNHGLQFPGYSKFRASSASTTIRGQFESSTSISYSYMHSKFLDSGGNIPIRMPYVKYEGKSTVRNTRWPGIRIKRALPSNFPYLRYEVWTDGRIGCLSLNSASTRCVQRVSGRGSASPHGFKSGDSNLSKLTECLCGYAIN